MIAFLLSPLGRYLMVGIAAAAIGFGGAWTLQGWRLSAVKAEYSEFKAGVKAEGEAAQMFADAKAHSDKQKKDKADAANKQSTDSLKRDIKRMRDERAGSNYLPSPAPGTPDSIGTCFDRSKLESAIRGLVDEIQGLIEQGDFAVIDLNTAKEWATSKE